MKEGVVQKVAVPTATQGAERKCLRSMFGVIRMDRMRNGEIGRRFC